MPHWVFPSWPSCISPLNTSCLGDAARTVRATRECVNQREMSTTFKRFFRLPEKLRPRRGDRFAIIESPFSLTIPCHPGKRSGNRQKKRRCPRRLPGAAVHEQLHGDCAERPSRLCARGEQGPGDASGHRVGHRRGALHPSRFAAADVASADFKAKAISLVLAGGLVGGIVGPETSKLTVDLLQTHYLGAYLSLIGFLVLVVLVVQLLDIPVPAAAAYKEPTRPLAQIMAQPVFVVAVLAAAIGYGVMNLLMTATPLAMGLCGHPYSAAATVIGWHVIGMFGPSFFTGSLIKRFGVPR